MSDSSSLPKLYSDNNKHIPPDGAQVGWLETDAGKLRYAIWQTSGIAPRGTVVFNHGLSEHIEKYFNVISGLIARGYAVVAHDWRNHGLSAPYAHGDYFEQHDADLTQLMEEIVLRSTQGPHFAIGHSMGGCLALSAAKNHPDWFKGVALCSPMLGLMAVRKIPMLKAIGRGMAFMPAKARDMLGRLKASHRYTNSFINFEAYQEFVKNSPALKMDSYDTVSWFNSAVKRMTMMQESTWLSQVKTPMLLLLAGADNLVDNDAAINSGTYLDNCDLRVVTSAWHELFMEEDNHQEAAWAALDSFFQSLEGPAPGMTAVAEEPAATPPPPSAKPVPKTLKFNSPSSGEQPQKAELGDSPKPPH